MMKYKMMRYLLIITIFFTSTHLHCQPGSENHALFDTVKSLCEKEIGNKCDTFNTHSDDNVAKGRIVFLNSDFSTKSFSSYGSVKYWYCDAKDDNAKRMHLGIISILFQNETDKKIAVGKIKSAKRTNFKVKLLTKFKLKESADELIIIYSETVRNEKISAFMKKV